MNYEIDLVKLKATSTYFEVLFHGMSTENAFFHFEDFD